MANVDTIRNTSVGIIAKPARDTGRLAIAGRSNRASIDTIRNLPDRMATSTTASNTACILGRSSNVGLVHTIDDVNLHCTILTGTCDTTSTQTASNGATLVDNEVFNNRSLTSGVRITTKVAEEPLSFGIGTVNNHVFDAMTLPIESCIVLPAVIWADRAMEVNNVFKIDVIHQFTIQVEVVVSDLLRDPFHITCIAEHVEAVGILFWALEVFVAFVVHGTDTIYVSVVICESCRTHEPHKPEDDKRGNFSHYFWFLVN